jgi:hypothetical protein
MTASFPWQRISSLNWTQPHNDIIVTRLIEQMIQVTWRSTEGHLSNSTCTLQSFLRWLDENVPCISAEDCTCFVLRLFLWLLYGLEYAQLTNPKYEVENWLKKKNLVLSFKSSQNKEKCKDCNKHPCVSIQNWSLLHLGKFFVFSMCNKILQIEHGSTSV